ncbi:AlpA family transcriptional regulator [Nocardiopsis sp. CC223A]|uniref:helix-turn-helix transcriptional regulator n=1 Tax=Nocardiopsis sp. CC223A TaxID=3044051 RepID=UPI002795F8FD|nr:helix-turn-helix domain-containing protein [Nocardiopsis sp. CC223A]
MPCALREGLAARTCFTPPCTSADQARTTAYKRCTTTDRSACTPLPHRRPLRGDVQIDATARASGRVHSWLSVDDICADLDVAKSTFHDWRAKGRAPRCTKLPNGALRIRRQDYEEWLQDLEEK